MWPITFHAPREQHRLVRLLEQEVVLDQALLGLLVDADGLGGIGCGASQRIVVTAHVTGQGLQGTSYDALQLLALVCADARWEGESADTAAGPHTRRDDETLVDDSVVKKLAAVQVWRRVGQGGVAVPGHNDRMHQLLELCHALGVAKEDANLAHIPLFANPGLVDATFDALVEGDTQLGLLILELVIHLLRHDVPQEELPWSSLQGLTEVIPATREVARRVDLARAGAVSLILPWAMCSSMGRLGIKCCECLLDLLKVSHWQGPQRCLHLVLRCRCDLRSQILGCTRSHGEGIGGM
mmetsp:Transcript_91598/g.165406  ORF Transcript_91598/g.165406 Transcript_91598/m.165406 type:complete len:297 (+) Transcript_91598:641-1531(+)